jgi:hypothetical protein
MSQKPHGKINFQIYSTSKGSVSQSLFPCEPLQKIGFPEISLICDISECYFVESTITRDISVRIVLYHKIKMNYLPSGRKEKNRC